MEPPPPSQRAAWPPRQQPTHSAPLARGGGLSLRCADKQDPEPAGASLPSQFRRSSACRRHASPQFLQCRAAPSVLRSLTGLTGLQGVSSSARGGLTLKTSFFVGFGMFLSTLCRPGGFPLLLETCVLPAPSHSPDRALTTLLLCRDSRLSQASARVAIPRFWGPACRWVRATAQGTPGFRPVIASSRSPGLWPHPAGAGGAADPPGKRGLATALGAGGALRATALSPTPSSGSQQRSRVLLECLVGGVVIVAGRTAGLQGGQRATQRLCVKASRPAGRGTGRLWSPGPWGSRGRPTGQGEREQPASLPAGLSEPPRPSSGARGQRARSALRRRRSLGRKTCHLPGQASDLWNWDGRPLPRAEASEGSCLSAPLAEPAHRRPAQHWMRWAVGTGGLHAQLGRTGRGTTSIRSSLTPARGQGSSQAPASLDSLHPF